MLPMTFLHLVAAGPEPEDVKAGWTAFIIFLLLFAAVVVLGFSLSKQFKKIERNRRAGVLPSTKNPVDPFDESGSAGNQSDR